MSSNEIEFHIVMKYIHFKSMHMFYNIIISWIKNFKSWSFMIIHTTRIKKFNYHQSLWLITKMSVHIYVGVQSSPPVCWERRLTSSILVRIHAVQTSTKLKLLSGHNFYHHISWILFSINLFQRYQLFSYYLS